MEPRFINQYKVTLDMCRYWACHPFGKKAVHDRKKGIFLRRVLLICSIIIILCGFLTGEIFGVFSGLVFMVIAVNRLFFLPKRVVKKQYEMILKAQNRDSWINRILFSDAIYVESGNSTARYDYAEILKMMEDQYYFYLFINEDMVLRIYKGGFLEGTDDDFRQFCETDIINKLV